MAEIVRLRWEIQERILVKCSLFYKIKIKKIDSVFFFILFFVLKKIKKFFKIK